VAPNACAWAKEHFEVPSHIAAGQAKESTSGEEMEAFVATVDIDPR